VPPGHLADDVLTPIADEVEALLAVVRERCGTDAAGSVAIDAALPGGARVVGTVGGVVGDVVLDVTYSKLAAKHRLAAWVRLLALTAASPERPWSAESIGRSSKKAATVCAATLPALGSSPRERSDRAAALLDDLVALHRLGMREPLPLYCKTSAAYATAAFTGQGAVKAAKAAEREWKSGLFPGEEADGAHVAVLGEMSVDDLLAVAPRDDECAPDWPETEDHRLGRYARRLWDPILAHEEIEDR
jgi:exodeoxyribonuclease V gamma subunit